MRPVYIACPAFLGPGGISSYTRRVIESLAPDPCDVLDLTGPNEVFEAPPNARVIASASTQLGFAARLARDWIQRDPTAFLFSHVGMTRPLSLLPEHSQHRVALLLHGIEAWVHLPRQRAAGLKRVDSFVFTTEYTRKMFLDFNAEALKREVETIVIPLSAEGAIESTVPGPVRTDPRRRVLCVTRLTRAEPLKGISTLLQAAARLSPAQWEVVIAGDGDGREDYEEESRRLGVSDRVRFIGWVDDATRTNALLDSDVFCLPSAQEGFGIAFLEAMVAGRPCVGASAGAVPEVLPPEAGELFPFGDADALAAALERAADRLRRGELTPQSIRSYYDRTCWWPMFRDRWQEYLTKLRS